MAYLFEILLFLAPFGAYLLWRRLNPEQEPSSVVLALAAIGVLLGFGAAVWYGLSRSMDRGAVYVPAEIRGGEVLQGHPEPPS